jgi:hypothetical protein
MNGPGKSDRPVVPTKRSNKAGKPGAEVVEGRGLVEGNTDKQHASRTQSRTHDVPSALDRVREAARIRHDWPDERFDVRTRGRSPVR